MAHRSGELPLKCVVGTPRPSFRTGPHAVMIAVWGVGIDGIRRRVRTSAPWWDLPVGFGPWQTVYGLFRRRQRAASGRRR
ncbi:transposase [Streptomyces sp. TLI_55]|uniref:transposase n=1 Tax=Streptomyces sp. TLI_55 TaxID=1938861 RepID=UPI00359C42B0